MPGPAPRRPPPCKPVTPESRARWGHLLGFDVCAPRPFSDLEAHVALDDRVMMLRRAIKLVDKNRRDWRRVAQTGRERIRVLSIENERLLALARLWCLVCADEPTVVHAHIVRKIGGPYLTEAGGIDLGGDGSDGV